MTHSKLRQTQLTILGNLDAATIEVKLHVYNGVIDRSWWIVGKDDDEDLVLMWSDRTAEGPHGGISLAELLTQLLEITRLLREPSE